MAKHSTTKVASKELDRQDCPHILNEGKDGMTWDWFVAMYKTPMLILLVGINNIIVILAK